MNENDAKKMLQDLREMVHVKNQSAKNLEPYQSGINLFVNEEFEKAVEAFRQAIEITPNFPFSHYYLGRSLRRLGKFREAIITLNRAIELNPLHAPSHAYLGNIFLFEQNFIKAEKYFRQALDLQFDNIIALKGLVKLAKNRFEKFSELAEFLKNAYFKGGNNPIFLMELFSFQNPDTELCLEITDHLNAQKSFHRAAFFYRLVLRETPENTIVQAKIDQVLNHC